MSDPPIRDPKTDPAPEILTTQEATGAVQKGTGMFTMLTVSLILAVAVLFGLYLAFGVHHASKPDADHAAIANTATSNTFAAPEPAAKPDPANGTANSAN